MVVLVVCTKNKNREKYEAKRENVSMQFNQPRYTYMHMYVYTHLFMSFLMVQSAPEHANDFHYANVCKSDPTI
jgi:hypothetical protein